VRSRARRRRRGVGLSKKRKWRLSGAWRVENFGTFSEDIDRDSAPATEKLTRPAFFLPCCWDGAGRQEALVVLREVVPLRGLRLTRHLHTRSHRRLPRLARRPPRGGGLHSSTSQLNLSRVCHKLKMNTPHILNTPLNPLNMGYTTPDVHPLSHTKRSS